MRGKQSGAIEVELGWRHWLITELKGFCFVSSLLRGIFIEVFEHMINLDEKVGLRHT